MNFFNAVLACVERASLYALLRYQIVLALTAIIEAVNVLLVASLVSYLLIGEMNVALLAMIDLMDSVGLINKTSGLTVELIVYIMVTIGLSAVLAILNIFVLSHIAADAGRRLANKILQTFLQTSPNEVLSEGPNSVSKLLMLETQRVTDHIFQNVAQMNARIYAALVLCGLLLYTSASAFLVSATVFLFAYLGLMLIVRRNLSALGKSISTTNAERVQVIEEMTSGYKEIKSLSVERYFDVRLAKAHLNYALAYRNLNLIYNAPRFVIEMIIFGCLAFLTAINISVAAINSSIDISQFLPVFGLAALKLLPIFQQIYSGIAQIKAHIPAAVAISDYLQKSPEKHYFISQNSDQVSQQTEIQNTQLFNGIEDIYFEGLSFRYGNTGDNFLFNFQLKKGSINFIMGPSGSGKTTLLEILSDLRSPNAGKFKIGSTSFDLSETSLRKVCSYSTQRSLFLACTVKENLTLGRDILECEIDRALKASQFSDFAASLPNGLHTPIGMGIRELSVGQLQRLGLARHLLSKPEILILDEPTSNLDQDTATSIFAALREIAKTNFVVCVTHDVQLIQANDNIINIQDGRTQLN